MSGTAALLIDLENFFIGREELFRRTHGDEPYEFPIDLDSLCQFATELAGGRRLVVRRAYANFNDRRPGDGERRWDYYLQPQPRFLMEQGIEPVQVFRFPGGSNKNAADMRLAMDATALLTGRSHVEQFIIVTGDSDFIPLVLELKRSGAEVVVIGVTGCTKPIFARYCDRFEYFEDLLAARELQDEDRSDLRPVQEALFALLERKSPIKFAAVKPLLSNELGQPFDPSRFGCETTGDFLRRYAGSLGISVRKGEHDWEIDLGDDAVRVEAVGEPAGDVVANEATVSPAAAPSGMDHSADAYRDLLRQGVPRCYVVSPDEWRTIVETIHEIVSPVDGEPPPAVLHQDILSEATDACIEKGLSEASRKVRDVAFQLFKSGCFFCADDGAEPGRTDFHWSRPARLADDIETPSDMTRRAWRFLIELLSRRVEQRGMRGPVRLEPLLELLAGDEPAEEERSILEQALSERTAESR